MSKEPYPADVEETEGWPAADEELPIRADAVAPDAGKVPYPDDMPEPSGWPDEEQ